MSKSPDRSEEQGTRLDQGLSSLVERFFPLPKQDEDDFDRFDRENHNSGVELVKIILEGHKTLAVEPDANHIADLIEHKLLHEYQYSEKAAAFSELYERLAGQRVLTQKWAVLHFMYQLANPNPDDEAFSDSPASSAEGDGPEQTTLRLPDPNSPGPVPIYLRDGFPTTELPPLPSSHRSRSIESARTKSPTDRADRRKFEEAHGAAEELPSREQDGFQNLPTGGSKGRRLKPAHRTGGENPYRKKDRFETLLYDESLGRKIEEVHDVDREYPSREEIDSKNLRTEAALLRDLPYALQGLSTTHLQFTSSSQLVIAAQLPLPLVSLLHALAEPSLLYRDLSNAVQKPVQGMIAQSLTSAIGTELRSYLALVATLEGEIRQYLKTSDGEVRRDNSGRLGVTLKRCVVWTREATMGLRLMSMMVRGVQSRKGGRLISMIHQLSDFHGDPFIAAFAERILVHVTKPFYDILRQWIYDGELSDPFREFFVTLQDPSLWDTRKSDSRRRDPALNEWDHKYTLNTGMVPTIMTGDLGRKAFLIGKSLNFLRHGCGDSEWVEAYCKGATRELHYGNTATLEKSIDKAYKATMARLTHLMIGKFHLFEHLQALKKYILLGQGDFIALLLECLASNLDQPAGSQYRHVLTGQLENAIRGSNAQYDDEEILHRLDVKILELSHGDIGWDVFSLEYKVDSPVNVIITHGENQKYLKMFNLLWRVKRVEFSLGSTWRRCMTGARGVLADLDDEMSKDWKAARCCMAEMIHFVNHFQYYILFEVIEASWDKLQAAITKPDCTLDGLIEAHSKYLDSITRKGLFGAPRHPTTGTREEALSSQLHYLLKTMLAYRDAVDGLYTFSVADFTRRQERGAQVERSSRATPLLSRAIAKSSRSVARLPIKERADSPFPANDILVGASPGESEDQMLSALRVRLGELSNDFRARVATLLGDLGVQSDVNMRFLAVVMNYNNIYEPRRRKGRGLDPKEETKTPEPAAAAVTKATDEKGDEEEVRGGDGGEVGKEIEAGDSRVASRTVAFERPKAKREGRDGNGKSEGGKSDVAAGNPKATSRTSSRPTSKLKEEQREGSHHDDGKKQDEKNKMASRTAATTTKTTTTTKASISERPHEKHETKNPDARSQDERNHRHHPPPHPPPQAAAANPNPNPKVPPSQQQQQQPRSERQKQRR